jgi:hypothetical protein
LTVGRLGIEKPGQKGAVADLVGLKAEQVEEIEVLRSSPN